MLSLQMPRVNSTQSDGERQLLSPEDMPRGKVMGPALGSPRRKQQHLGRTHTHPQG